MYPKTNRTKNIFEKCENSVIAACKNSESFQMYRGVRQGNVLFPMLFNMVMDETM
jgi:hypothetical protein